MMTMKHYALPVCAAALLAGCALPRSSPTYDEVKSSAEDGQIELRLVDAASAQFDTKPTEVGFPSQFLAAPEITGNVLGAGDVVSVRIFESGTPAVYGSSGGQLGELVVDDDGRLFIPHAGAISLAGLTASQARSKIAARLRTVVRNPQVDIRLVNSRSSLVSVQGTASNPGSFPIERGRSHLGELVAQTVQKVERPEMVRVTLQRGDQAGSIRLADLQRSTAFDVALRPGDRVLVDTLDENVMVLGGAGIQGQVPIVRSDFSLLDVLGQARGLDDNVADPSAVFVIRFNDGDPIPVVYHFEMQRPEIIALASRFPVHDKDAVFISNAPFKNARLMIQSLSQSISAVRNAVILAQ
ncbi:hypothetical protein EKN06_06665 [Croceicoccus ponticola]|uniref:Polysaccharide export protein N-terminal domain-containing protein n=1 Tax=Croceicoccus ponticola TaxID=2217664 RepID=A0A437GY74_9SPHN|nr:polysaccharide biosynthesis/export family protein [Croceicoccus ponticola]RVQ67622.1 hypothetical protein EKN06_06665 [Croceicoccus ponticola]